MLFGSAASVIGVDIVGITMAFGLLIVAMVYSIATISTCHVSPAVSIAMFLNKRMTVEELVYYEIAQILGGLLGTAILITILKSLGMPLNNLGQNSFGNLGASGSFVVKFVLIFVFILVIVVVTSEKGNANLAGIVIGFTLV